MTARKYLTWPLTLSVTKEFKLHVNGKRQIQQRETINLGVKKMNSKLQVKSRLPFDVNVMLNLSTERALTRVSGCVTKSRALW